MLLNTQAAYPNSPNLYQLPQLQHNFSVSDLLTCLLVQVSMKLIAESIHFIDNTLKLYHWALLRSTLARRRHWPKSS
ncbi:hypothetical protein C7B82_15155 [Stenomitos frigidus ULC18]|uniref:Uncharacterized protein n=1 Tax=Stenomitos frigidus ULC18 TaxID=2107698 RepID=A0A2T1E697_9CYAN|nr:hypothetical protein C7B82_15155 [Stenomitos frigidus ULC18]